MSDADLAELPLDEDLANAIRAAAGMRAHGALRRQRQLIGKLMARADVEAIRRAYDAQRRPEHDNKRVFRDAERWRDRLLKTGAGELPALAAETGMDTGPLEPLVINCRSARAETERRRHARQLFRELHAALRRIRVAEDADR